MSNSLSISAKEIRRIRKKLGLSQAELADALNLTRGTIAHWEAGRCSPTGPANVLLRQLEAAHKASLVLQKTNS